MLQNNRSATNLRVFQLAFEARDESLLPKYAEDELAANLNWLKEHLKSPKTLKDEVHQRAISWFHAIAPEPLLRIRSVKAKLEEIGYHIEQVESRDPGIMLYEDGWQVVAKPYKNSN